MSRVRVLLFCYFSALVCSTHVASPQVALRSAGDQVIGSALAIISAPGFPETIGSKDPIEAEMVSGAWIPPRAGDRITYNDTLTATWERVTADSLGWFHHQALDGGYVYAGVTAGSDETILLEAMGHSMVYVNAEPRAGNPYQQKETWESWEPHFDYSLLPVRLHKGRNDFLFQCNRGVLKIRLHEPRSEVLFNAADATVPDLVRGQPVDGFASLVVINASNHSLRQSWIRVTSSDGESVTSPVPLIQPESLRKIGFRIRGAAPNEPGSRRYTLTLLGSDAKEAATLDTASLVLRVVNANENRKETFKSSIDGSVQYFSLLPAQNVPPGALPALILSLHGAAVEALNQSASYFPKTWATILCPTNRRPYGYNWEDWGRMDALEVLRIACREYSFDRNKVYLTGHSMGGHGVYHIGTLYPDRFAAIGPSAGWISFWSYRIRETIEHPSPIRRMIQRAALTSDTYAMAGNLRQLGVYILHGSLDDNVSVEESRSMASHLATFHHDFIFHEQAGAGHWWDTSDEPGADCVDWPPLFDFFARHARPSPEMVRQIDFLVANPGVSSRDYWLTIEAQREQLLLSSVSIRVDPGMRRFTGTTKNVERLAIDLSMLSAGPPVAVTLDGQKIERIAWPTGETTIWLEMNGNSWSSVARPSLQWKGPHRYGTLKDVIRNNVVFVYGTGGTKEEQRWAFAKARFDAERFWYQGNGSVDVVADIDFDPSVDQDRNVLLFGNAGTNSAWNALLPGSPVMVDDGRVVVGNRTFRGNTLGCVFVRPRPGSDSASVGVIGGSGIAGMRLTNKMSYMLPGIGFPDCLVENADVLTDGESGIRAAGYFGIDWSFDHGEFAWGTDHGK